MVERFLPKYTTEHARTSTQTNTTSKPVSIFAVVNKVYYVYTEDESGKSVKIPGTIEVSPIGSGYQSAIITAYPLDEYNLTMPLPNEIVEVFMHLNPKFYRRPSVSATINYSGFNIDGSSPDNITPIQSKADYKNQLVTKTGASSKERKFGDTFTPSDNVHRLKIYDGDTIIQSRFGQSIRFSGYNNVEGKEHPTIIIRNKESADSANKPLSHTTEEDINKDGSTLLIGSGKYTSNFLPGTVNNGKSNFKLKVYEPQKSRNAYNFSSNKTKYGFEEYPRKLDGNQIIITSDRLIFSSRLNEIIFWSKGQYGVITDSVASIDAEKGINLISHNGDIDLEGNNINFNTKNGTLNLGTGKGKTLTPTVDGKALVELLGKVIDEMENLCLGGVLTPSGPASGINPANKARLANIRNTLTSLLSQTVWIAK
jgi:hypothetical protein